MQGCRGEGRVCGGQAAPPEPPVDGVKIGPVACKPEHESAGSMTASPPPQQGKPFVCWCTRLRVGSTPAGVVPSSRGVVPCSVPLLNLRNHPGDSPRACLGEPLGWESPQVEALTVGNSLLSSFRQATRLQLTPRRLSATLKLPF